MKIGPRAALAAIALGAAIGAASTAVAQTFPVKPVTIVVPYPPGGLIDLTARILQSRLTAELGQPVLVENRSGAGGNLGAEQVARAAPDGYTLLMANPSNGISGHIYPKLNYRPAQDFAFVGLLGTVPNVLMVHPSFPAKTVAELVDQLKRNPGKFNYASNGVGTSPQLSMELFKSVTNTFVVHIPFRGSGPATAATLANETQMMFDNIPPQVGNIKAGKFRALATTGRARSSALPDLPTMIELGYKDFEVTAWFGLAAPSGTPREVVQRLNQAQNRAAEHPDVRKGLEDRGATVYRESAEWFTKFVSDEFAKWGPVVKRAGIVAE